MESARPARLTGSTNELARERNRAAAERTMIAWIQNCLILIGFGVAVDQINLALQASLWRSTPIIRDGLVQFMALGFIALGIGLLGIALVQYRLEVNSIEREDYAWLSVTRLHQFMVVALLIFGVAASIAIWLSL